jgi:acetolactate synthase I/II/III large subunit
MNADYCLYTIGLGSGDRISNAIDHADLVITVGFDMVEYHPQLWNPNSDKKILHADFLPAEIDEHYHPETELIGDIAHTLSMLNQRIEAEPLPDFDLALQHQVRQRMAKDIAEYKDDETRDSIRPQKAIWDARQVMAPCDILLSDVGAHKMWVARHYQCHEPNTCLIPNGFASMGFALPGAIAADIVFPDRRILAIAGDAGFLMNVQEMETAVRIGSNIVVMVWEDHAYGLIEWKQQTHFGRHSELSFGNPDWTLLAKSFDWNGHYVKNAADLAATLDSAFDEKGPSLVVIPIDYRENLLLTKKIGEITCRI